jgi:hypothetical protein
MVRTKDERTYVEPILDDGSGPTLDCWPMAPVVAETPAQAKALFLREFAPRLNTGVETDDYPNLRVRTLVKNVDLPPGVRADDPSLWLYEPEPE